MRYGSSAARTWICTAASRQATKHALLAGRLDEEQDRITQNNPNLLGAKRVIDLVRSANVGVTGRIGAKREAEFEESTLIEAIREPAERHGVHRRSVFTFPQAS